MLRFFYLCFKAFIPYNLCTFFMPKSVAKQCLFSIGEDTKKIPFRNFFSKKIYFLSFSKKTTHQNAK